MKKKEKANDIAKEQSCLSRVNVLEKALKKKKQTLVSLKDSVEKLKDPFYKLMNAMDVELEKNDQLTTTTSSSRSNETKQKEISANELGKNHWAELGLDSDSDTKQKDYSNDLWDWDSDSD